MIPTVLIDLPTSLALGHIFAFLGRKTLLRHEKFSQMPMGLFTLVLVYGALVFVPITGYFCFAYPDWSYSYLWAPEKIPFYFSLIAVLGYLLMMLIGWVSATFWILQRKSWMAFIQLIWSLAAVGVVLMLTHQEYMHIGDYFSYRGGLAVSIFEDRIFFLKLNILGGILVVATFVFGYLSWRGGERHHEHIRL